MDKAALRARIREARQARPPDEQPELAEQLAARAIAFIPDEPRDVTCYSSLPGEPGTGPLIASLIARGHRVWLPRIAGSQLTWVRVDAESVFETGPMGIRQPVGHGVDSLDFADVVLMPALAVDRSGRRLGQGGGFYDRSLAAAAPLADGGPVLVALVFDDEVVDDVPTEGHDRPVDAIVTPLRTLRTGRSALVD